MRFKRALVKLEAKHNVVEAKNGEEALAILNKKEWLPDLILQDIHMPKMNGLVFLQALKKDDTLRYIPSIVFTTSSNPSEIKEAYKAGIAGYLVKPHQHEAYTKLVKNLLNYWTCNKLIRV